MTIWSPPCIFGTIDDPCRDERRKVSTAGALCTRRFSSFGAWLNLHRSPRVHLPFWKSKHGFPLKVDVTGREAEAEEEEEEEEAEAEVVEVGAASSSELPSLP